MFVGDKKTGTTLNIKQTLQLLCIISQYKWLILVDIYGIVDVHFLEIGERYFIDWGDICAGVA